MNDNGWHYMQLIYLLCKEMVLDLVIVSRHNLGDKKKLWFSLSCCSSYSFQPQTVASRLTCCIKNRNCIVGFWLQPVHVNLVRPLCLELKPWVALELLWNLLLLSYQLLQQSRHCWNTLKLISLRWKCLGIQAQRNKSIIAIRFCHQSVIATLVFFVVCFYYI